MRIVFMTVLITLIALPLMAKTFDASRFGNSDMAARLMAVVSEDLAKTQAQHHDPKVAALASELNDINVQ